MFTYNTRNSNKYQFILLSSVKTYKTTLQKNKKKQNKDGNIQNYIPKNKDGIIDADTELISLSSTRHVNHKVEVFATQSNK